MLLKALKKIGESNESRNSNTIIGNADRNNNSGFSFCVVVFRKQRQE